MPLEKATLKASKKECTACSTCATFKADNLRHTMARLSGVSKVKVDGISGKVTLEYDNQKIDLPKITKRIEKLGYEVEVVTRERS
jgi:copper chaperone CopZ